MDSWDLLPHFGYRMIMAHCHTPFNSSLYSAGNIWRRGSNLVNLDKPSTSICYNILFHF